MSVVEMFRFETANFVIRATIQPDEDIDMSWDEDGETREKLNSGEYQAFATIVTVAHNGLVLGESSLWGSIYTKPEDFFTGHRNANPMNRNCSAMRAVHGGNVTICHYFPDMVSEAVGQARKAIATMPKVRTA